MGKLTEVGALAESTVRAQTAFFLLWVRTVMFALPMPTAVTLPLASTRATLLLLLVQVGALQ